MDRDALLAAALGAAVLTGCTTSSRDPSPTPTPQAPSPTPDDPDLDVLVEWSLAERSLARRYDGAVEALPSLGALRANHAARADEVDAHLRVRGATPPQVPERAPLRGRPASLVRAFGTAERLLERRYLARLGAVTDPRVAVLGAELAAGARQHGTVLQLLRVPR